MNSFKTYLLRQEINTLSQAEALQKNREAAADKQEYEQLYQKIFFNNSVIRGKNPLITLDQHDFREILDKEKVAKKLKKELLDAVFQQDPDQNLKSRYLLKEKISPLKEAKTAIAHAKGDRPSQEDAHATGTISFCFNGKKYQAKMTALFDGHGGSGASSFCAQNVQTAIKKRIDSICSREKNWETALWNSLKLACVDLDRAYNGTGGTTANIALRIKRENIHELWIANVGDSRAVVISKEEALSLSEDAKIDNEKYAKGSIKRGGQILLDKKSKNSIPRINGILAVGRAIGDHELYGAVNPRPKVIRYIIQKKNKYLVQCCDGVFDVLSSREIARFLNTHKFKIRTEDKAKALVKHAYALGSTDNITAMITPL